MWRNIILKKSYSLILFAVIILLTIQTKEVFAPVSCTDTDSGNYPEIFGFCQEDSYNFPDTCYGNDLTEYVCDQNNCQDIVYNCNTYCKNTYGSSYTGTCSSTVCVCSGAGTTAGSSEPIKLTIKSPKDGDTIKRGILTLLVEAFEGTTPSSQMAVTAESELFGKIALENQFGHTDVGTYGANVTIGKNVTKGSYKITVTARRRSIAEEKISVNADPTIYINTTLEKNYSKGERIVFKGNLNYFDNSSVNKSNVKISISAKDFAINKTIKSDENGMFEDSYLISFAEPDGIWDVRIIATDSNENLGLVLFSPKISTPEGVAFYVVNFLSPLKNADFKRGSTIPLTVEIRDEGNFVENATVDLKTPQGDVIKFEEIKPGTYISDYTLTFSDPIGIWNIPVQAVKTANRITKAGGTRLPVNIVSADLNLLLLNPIETNFFTGESVEIKAELKYPDGLKVENARVNAKIINNTIELMERAPGVYSNNYLFSEKDAGSGFMQISAVDLYENSIKIPNRAIRVESVSPFELVLLLLYNTVVLRYWYIWAFILIAIGIVTRPVWYGKYLNVQQKRMTEEEKNLLSLKKELQLKYFKLHSVNKENYDKLMFHYNERTLDLNETKISVQKELKKITPMKWETFVETKTKQLKDFIESKFSRKNIKVLYEIFSFKAIGEPPACQLCLG